MPININTSTKQRNQKKKMKIQKSLQDYISRIKKPQTPQLPLHSNIFSPCNHPKTPSFDWGHGARDDNGDNVAATPGDVDGLLSQNFKSLYVKDDDKDNPGEIPRCRARKQRDEGECHPFGDVILFDSPRLIYPPLNLRGSKRFFIASGSSGRSLMEEARSSILATSSSEDIGSSSTSSTTTNTVATTATTVTAAMDRTLGRDSPRGEKEKLPDNCIAVVARTHCPYGEFKRSMQEVAESHGDGTVDWEFMEEMLMCYLNLNERKSHKYILSAFVDVVVMLRHRRDPGERVTSKSRDVRSNKRRDNIKE